MADERVVNAILQAISGNESGGNYEVWNKQGEPSYGKYQFLPSTWKTWAGRYASDKGLDVPVEKIAQSPSNQEIIAKYKVSSLLDGGYSPEQVASIWNSGSPDYAGKAGTNKYGNRYDVPGYVAKFKKGFNAAMNALGPSEAHAAGLTQTEKNIAPKMESSGSNDIISEAQKRGLIDSNAAALLSEARKRGLLNGGMQSLQQSIPIDKSMDAETGAPYDVRLRVGNAQTPEDRLSTIRKTFPDAQPYEQDNFVYTDPKTGRPKLYNPKGFDIGDVPENTRLAAGVVGAAAGGLAGAALGATTGPGAAVASPAAAVVGGGAGTALALSLYDSLANVFGGTDDTRSVQRKLIDYGTEGASSMGGELVTGKVLNAIPNTIKGIRNKLAGVGSQTLSETFDRMGISKKGAAGAITGNRTIQGIQSTLHDLPTSANMMDEAVTKTLGDVKGYADELSRAYTFGATPGTSQDIGESIYTGSKGALDRFKTRSRELYDKLYTHIDKEEMVPVSNTIGYLYDSIKEWEKAPELGNRFVKGLMDIAKRVGSDTTENDELPFKVLQRLRSEVGDMLSSKASPGVDDIPTGQLKSLYGSIMSDIEGAVAAKGSDAKKAFDTASRYYRFNIGRNVDILEKIEKAGLPEKVFNLATQNQGKGGTTLYKIRRNMKPEEWDFVAGSMLDRMGRANPGAQNVEGNVWSPATFMTNWNRLSKEARNELFGIQRYKGLRKSLDDLLRVAASLKDAEKMVNRSKTGSFGEYTKVITSPAVLLGTLLGSMTGSDTEGKLSGAAGGFVAATIAPHYAAKLMTNEKFVEWLARGAQIKSPSAIQTHLGRLTGLAASEEYLKPAIDAYLQNIEQTLEVGK